MAPRPPEDGPAIGSGQTIPKIAHTPQLREVHVRYWIRHFLASEFGALPDQPHVGQRWRLAPEILASLRQELKQSAPRAF